MAHLPQNCMFRYLGFDDGVDMPLHCELLEFGENTLASAWEEDIPAPPFNRLFHLVGGPPARL